LTLDADSRAVARAADNGIAFCAMTRGSGVGGGGGGDDDDESRCSRERSAPIESH